MKKKLALLPIILSGLLCINSLSVSAAEYEMNKDNIIYEKVGKDITEAADYLEYDHSIDNLEQNKIYENQPVSTVFFGTYGGWGLVGDYPSINALTWQVFCDIGQAPIDNHSCFIISNIYDLYSEENIKRDKDHIIERHIKMIKENPGSGFGNTYISSNNDIFYVNPQPLTFGSNECLVDWHGFQGTVDIIGIDIQSEIEISLKDGVKYYAGDTLNKDDFVVTLKYGLKRSSSADEKINTRNYKLTSDQWDFVEEDIVLIEGENNINIQTDWDRADLKNQEGGEILRDVSSIDVLKNHIVSNACIVTTKNPILKYIIPIGFGCLFLGGCGACLFLMFAKKRKTIRGEIITDYPVKYRVVLQSDKDLFEVEISDGKFEFKDIKDNQYTLTIFDGREMFRSGIYTKAKTVDDMITLELNNFNDFNCEINRKDISLTFF